MLTLAELNALNSTKCVPALTEFSPTVQRKHLTDKADDEHDESDNQYQQQNGNSKIQDEGMTSTSKQITTILDGHGVGATELCGQY
jgi:hypothetical protein